MSGIPNIKELEKRENLLNAQEQPAWIIMSQFINW